MDCASDDRSTWEAFRKALTLVLVHVCVRKETLRFVGLVNVFTGRPLNACTRPADNCLLATAGKKQGNVDTDESLQWRVGTTVDGISYFLQSLSSQRLLADRDFPRLRVEPTKGIDVKPYLRWRIQEINGHCVRLENVATQLWLDGRWPESSTLHMSKGDPHHPTQIHWVMKNVQPSEERVVNNVWKPIGLGLHDHLAWLLRAEGWTPAAEERFRNMLDDVKQHPVVGKLFEQHVANWCGKRKELWNHEFQRLLRQTITEATHTVNEPGQGITCEELREKVRRTFEKIEDLYKLNLDSWKASNALWEQMKPIVKPIIDTLIDDGDKGRNFEEVAKRHLKYTQSNDELKASVYAHIQDLLEWTEPLEDLEFWKKALTKMKRLYAEATSSVAAHGLRSNLLGRRIEDTFVYIGEQSKIQRELKAGEGWTDVIQDRSMMGAQSSRAGVQAQSSMVPYGGPDHVNRLDPQETGNEDQRMVIPRISVVGNLFYACKDVMRQLQGMSLSSRTATRHSQPSGAARGAAHDSQWSGGIVPPNGGTTREGLFGSPTVSNTVDQGFTASNGQDKVVTAFDEDAAVAVPTSHVSTGLEDSWSVVGLHEEFNMSETNDDPMSSMHSREYMSESDDDMDWQFPEWVVDSHQPETSTLDTVGDSQASSRSSRDRQHPSSITPAVHMSAGEAVGTVIADSQASGLDTSPAKRKSSPDARSPSKRPRSAETATDAPGSDHFGDGTDRKELFLVMREDSRRDGLPPDDFLKAWFANPANKLWKITVVQHCERFTMLQREFDFEKKFLEWWFSSSPEAIRSMYRRLVKKGVFSEALGTST